MKKILKKKWVKIAFVIVVIAALVLFCFIFRTDDNMVTRVIKVLWAKYYNVECIGEDCKFVVAYKGDKKGKSKVKIINSNGKTVAKYTIEAKDELKKVPVAAANKYVILALKDKKDYTHGYSVINSKGREVINEDKFTLFTITDELFYGKNGDLYTIYDYNGNVLYKNIKNLTFYNNGKIITFVNNTLNIINEKSERILNDYEIDKEVKEKDETLYLIVKDKDNSYYYFDVHTYNIVGDSFFSYNVMSDNRLIVSRKINNDIKKYLINVYGIEEKEVSSKTKAIEKIKKQLKDGYELEEDSVLNTDQKGVLVVNKEDNSLGTYNIKSGYYYKLFSFNNENRKIAIYNLYEDLESARLEVGCTKDYCTEETIVVYNPYDNSVTFKISNTEKEIKKYREYTGEYKVVTYTDKTYSLIDKDNQEVLNSSNNIIVLGQRVIVDDEASKSNVILYSTNDKKTLNNDETLAILDKKSNYNIYKFYDEKSLYLYNIDGELLKEIPISESSIAVGDKYISYLSKNKLNVYSLIDNKTVGIDIAVGEAVIDANNAPIVPNKGAIVISNTEDKNIKVLNYNKEVIKTIKNSTVKSVNFDKNNNSIFLITQSGENCGLYIIK